jgi:hypothetical protein
VRERNLSNDDLALPNGRDSSERVANPVLVEKKQRLGDAIELPLKFVPFGCLRDEDEPFN